MIASVTSSDENNSQECFADIALSDHEIIYWGGRGGIKREKLNLCNHISLYLFETINIVIH